MEIKQNPAKKKTRKNPTPESQLRFALDTCSKTGDHAGALALYSAAVAASTPLSAYAFNTLLHIISSSSSPDTTAAGLAIFDRMLDSNFTPAESTITSVARIAARAPGGTQHAFDLARTMRSKYGVAPKLRTYGPALFGFCNAGDAGGAYAVESDMIANGVSLEEPEIAALLEVSAKVGNGEKVYEYLQKIRGAVGCVSEATAGVLEGWFGSEVAGGFGRGRWDVEETREAMARNGGGWLGFGWLGEGRWEVRRGGVSEEGRCFGCGGKLASVDIDAVETEKFAESVAGLALEREGKANFKNFQEWLGNHAEYEAIVDGANVAYFQQNFAEGGFSLPQLNMVVKEVCERSRSKWPLIILHKRRVNALLENPSYKEFIETWVANDALYITPSGSNDDWYWLYAAVKLKSLLVTNDEMRDHIFELLGRNYFLKWKERHQVKYSFTKGILKLLVPPPYSSVIQESETGSWHVPIDEKCSDERQRVWLCVTRPSSCVKSDEVGLAVDSTQTSADLQNTLLVENGNANGVARTSSSNPSHDKLITINGKRKEREPSLSLAHAE